MNTHIMTAALFLSTLSTTFCSAAAEINSPSTPSTPRAQTGSAHTMQIEHILKPPLRPDPVEVPRAIRHIHD